MPNTLLWVAYFHHLDAVRKMYIEIELANTTTGWISNPEKPTPFMPEKSPLVNIFVIIVYGT
jgi:hypothetical protein